MPNKISFSAIKEWLASTEMFARPSKKLPGKWELFEYYFEPEKELVHVEQIRMDSQKLFWQIDFAENDSFFHKTNVTVPLISKIDNGKWSIAKNFVTIINPDNFRNNVEFQFAVEKDVLKLLKKDGLGKIEFFGFFRRPKT